MYEFLIVLGSYGLHQMIYLCYCEAINDRSLDPFVNHRVSHILELVHLLFGDHEILFD